MVIRAEVAGIAPEKIDITVEDDVLTLSGSREEERTVEDGQWIRRERETGRFQRAVSLPPGVDANAIKANAENGVIEIRVPRPRAAEPHRVPLTSAQGDGAQAVEVGSGDGAEPSKDDDRRSTAQT